MDCIQSKTAQTHIRLYPRPVTHSSREPIYDHSERSDPNPQRHGESSFHFFNRIGGEYWVQSRDLIQSWIDNVADDEAYVGLRSRLRSPDDHATRSAYLELYLHEAMLRAGHRLQMHPQVATGTRQPDFLVTTSGQLVYIEAIVPGASHEEKAAAARIQDFFAIIDKLEAPCFFLSIDQLNDGPAAPPASKIRDLLQKWLRNLDPDTVEPGNRPTLAWQEGAWSGVVSVWPRQQSAKRHDRESRAIGIYAHLPARFVDDASTIRRALAAKDKAYGNLDAPFIVAVGLNIFDEDRWQVGNTLYGHQAVQIEELPDGSFRSLHIRKHDGYFGTPDNWKHTQVSAVLIVNQLHQYDPTLAEVSLWLHPGADHPLQTTELFPGEIVRLEDQDLQVDPAMGARKLFGLPVDWPQGEPWPRVE